MDFQFFHQADQAAFNLEKAKRSLELAKAALEAAKLAFDDVMARAEELGVPKAKLRKIVEERVQVLFDSGLVGPELSSAAAVREAAAKPERIKRLKKPSEAAAATTDLAESAEIETDSESIFHEAFRDDGSEADSKGLSRA